MEDLDTIILGYDGHRRMKDRFAALDQRLEHTDSLDLKTYEKLKGFIHKQEKRYAQPCTDYQKESHIAYQSLLSRFNEIEPQEKIDEGLARILEAKGKNHYWKNRTEAIREHIDTNEVSTQVLDYLCDYLEQGKRRLKDKAKSTHSLDTLQSYIQSRMQKTYDPLAENPSNPGSMWEERSEEDTILDSLTGGEAGISESLEAFEKRLKTELDQLCFEEPPSSTYSEHWIHDLDLPSDNPPVQPLKTDHSEIFDTPYEEVYGPIKRLGFWATGKTAAKREAVEQLRGFSRNEIREMYLAGAVKDCPKPSEVGLDLRIGHKTGYAILTDLKSEFRDMWRIISPGAYYKASWKLRAQS
ncbi:MAG: hypothetical protein ACQESG_06690 [Nanobdellota archaeon]